MPGDALTLKDQVEAACATLDQVRGVFPEPVPILLMGHSIGSWICIQVMKNRPGAVHTMFALFPTVSNIKNTPNGVRLSVRLTFIGSADMHADTPSVVVQTTSPFTCVEFVRTRCAGLSLSPSYPLLLLATPPT